MNQTDKRFELCETGGTVAELEALPFGSMVRAICSAANHGPDLLYEVMLKATLTIDRAVPTYGLSTWSLMSGRRPRLQWAEGLTNEELEEAEGAVAEAVSPKFDGSVRVGERST